MESMGDSLTIVGFVLSTDGMGVIYEESGIF